MKEYKIPRKTLFLWQIRSLIIWAILFFICWYYSFRIKTLLIAIGVISVIFLVFILFYLPKYFSTCKIKFFKNAVVVELGVILKTQNILPFARLIYTQTLSTPLSKLMGVTGVTLKAARSRIYIPEMSNDDLQEFLSFLNNGDEK